MNPGDGRPPRAILPCRRRQHRAPQCLNRSPGSSAGRLPTSARRRSVLRAVLCRGPEMVRRQRGTGLSRGRARNGRHRHRRGVRLSVDRRRRASGGRRDGLAPVRAEALGWPSRGFARRSTGVAIRSCLSEPVTPSGQASLSHRAWPLAGLPPRGGFADRPGGWPLHDGPAVRHRPHGRVAVTTRSPDHRRRHSKKAVNPGRLRRGNLDGAFARSGQGGVDHGGGAGSDRHMPLGGAPCNTGS